MPILVENPNASIGRGINQAAGALSGALQQQGLKRQQEQDQEKERERSQQYGSVLQSTLANLGPNASPLDVMTALAGTQSQGVPLDYATKYGTLYSTLEKANKQKFGPEQENSMTTLFQKFGQEEEEARRNAQLWGQLTTGGQTEFAKYLVDSIVRGDQTRPGGQFGVQPVEEVTEETEYVYPDVNVFEDRTPKERTQLKTELLKQNNAQIKNIEEKVNSKEKQLYRFNQLSSLNDSGKLPSGLERLNINWTTGDIRFPALANAETQLFVKTINDFTTEAKDTYGARVTNFELGAFMKRLPTLANTEEGRRLILAQMENMGQIDYLREKALQDVYDHYGTQKIDYATARKIANEKMKPDLDKLKAKQKNIVKAQEIYEAKTLAPEGKVPAQGPDGNIVYIWRHQADKAEKRGYKPL